MPADPQLLQLDYHTPGMDDGDDLRAALRELQLENERLRKKFGQDVSTSSRRCGLKAPSSAASRRGGVRRRQRSRREGRRRRSKRS